MITQDRAPTETSPDQGASGDDVAEFGVIGFELPRWYPKTVFGKFSFAVTVSLALWAFFGVAVYLTADAMTALP